jgi:GAF domain-containing protein
MSDAPIINVREIDTRLNNGRLIAERLLSQVQLGKVDPKLLSQRLTTIIETFALIIQDRQSSTENEKLATLYRLTRMISSSLELEDVLQKVMDAVLRLTSAERGFIMLVEKGELKVRFVRNFELENMADTNTISQTIIKRVMENGQPILTTNAQEDPRFAQQASVVVNSLSSIIACPLSVQGKIIGVIYVDNRAVTGLFTDEHLQLVTMFGEQAAVAIDNSLQVQERERRLKEQIEGLKIEIDETKRTRAVEEIVQTDYFLNLQAKAQEARRKNQKPGTDQTQEPK